MLRKKISFGTDQIQTLSKSDFPGNIAYLCHAASVDHHLNHGINLMLDVFGKQLTKIFSPQHGLMGTMQDNMIESDHFIHPHYQLPVYSLYSETRAPTPEMLKGIDWFFIDLQDIGCRIYTYIYTMLLSMQACGKKDIKVVILDRPNPIDGNTLEGNMLDPSFCSFVGMHPLPVRHGMTMGEIALYALKHWGYDAEVDIIKVKGWDRSAYWDHYDRAWVAPSPNMPSLDTAICFPGTVLIEGTQLSEGRGTCFPLTLIGHPKFQPHQHMASLNQMFQDYQLHGFSLRPYYFRPCFQKHQNQDCGGYMLHIDDRTLFRPWEVTQYLIDFFFQQLPNEFKWKEPPYEYEFDRNPMDMINGTDQYRLAIESNKGLSGLIGETTNQLEEFEEKRQPSLLY